ncbi:hypothetical protein OCH7691_00687 [Oceanibacterium hippocampi]|uniref:Uncharacterized protein n=1 Tax=Oceanibacterium hippocampi TaxID=745714 RepID=A0A1Y5RSM6_9PROT|nr:hypothetical protein OCH7691_00687 [Oceanibacterium hippocampi]
MPPPSLLEILAPPLDGIAYGVALEVGLDSREIAISRPA